jgi:hypothetical protein
MQFTVATSLLCADPRFRRSRTEEFDIVCTAADSENEEEIDDAILDTHAAWVGLFKVSEPNPRGKMLAFLLIRYTICRLSLKTNALILSGNHEWMKSIMYIYIYIYILCEGFFFLVRFRL